MDHSRLRRAHTGVEIPGARVSVAAADLATAEQVTVDSVIVGPTRIEGVDGGYADAILP